MNDIFISYAHVDNESLTEVEKKNTEAEKQESPQE
jgi:hypothetical protein